MTYRDPLAGLRSQVAVKRAVLVDREREVPPVLRALLPEETRASIAGLRAAANAEADTLEALAAADAALDGILAAFDGALERSTRLRWCADDAGTPPRPWIAPPWLIEEGSQLRTRRELDARLSLMEGEPVERWGDRGYRSHVLVAGARALFFFEVLSQEGGVDATSLLRVTVPETLDRITLGHQGLQHMIGKRLGLVRDLEIGDPDFDDRFLITGAAASAALLTSRVRGGLLELPGRHVRLSIGRGYATLTWTFPWRNVGREALPPAALAVMAGLREAIAEG